MPDGTERRVARWSGELYDAVSDPQARWGAEVVARLGDARVDDVLDAGCGSGRVTEVLALAHPDARITALDLSAEMLARAEERLARFGSRVNYLREDLGGDLAGLGERSFDAVFSTGTFHWVTDHERLYGRLFEALREGGRLVFQCGGEGSVAEVRKALDELGIEWRGFNLYAGLAETRRSLGAAGFEEVWTWLNPERVDLATREDLVDYLLGGALAPYVAHLEPAGRREVADAVAARLDRPTVDFVRLNVLARRPA